MSWRDVFRRDLRSTFRSRMGPAAVGLLLLATVGVAALIWVTANPEYPPGMGNLIVIFGSLMSFVVPLVALLASYAAVVGERTTGSVRFLLGLPNSRTDAYVGKLASRTLVVVAPLVVGLLVAGAITVPIAEDGAFLPFIWLAALSAVYAVLFVGVGLTASVVADTDTRAVSLVVGAFALLRAGWPALQWVGMQSLEDPYPHPEWYFWLGRLNPINAYVKLTTVYAPVERHPLITTPRDPNTGGFAGELPRESAAGSLAVSPELAAAVVLVLVVAAPVAGLLYFRQRDVL
jgi:ABC-2 type transport system permease protein